MKRTSLGTVALVSTFLLAACGGAKSPAASPGQPIPLTVNWTAVTGANSGLWTAYEAGYFKDEGLAVNLLHLPSSPRTVEALLTGDVQFGNGEDDDDRYIMVQRNYDRRWSRKMLTPKSRRPSASGRPPGRSFCAGER